jgi:hypothetical protein
MRVLAFIVALVIVVVAALILIPAFTRDTDSPIARMYRTEADLASLANAIDSYYDAKGVYPPPGDVGLAVALEHISQTVDYFPGGPPFDGWGRGFHYVPHSAYATRDSGALMDGEYFAPDSYQLYSSGADGDAMTLEDNITSWNTDQPWRAVYEAMDAT